MNANVANVKFEPKMTRHPPHSSGRLRNDAKQMELPRLINLSRREGVGRILTRRRDASGPA